MKQFDPSKLTTEAEEWVGLGRYNDPPKWMQTQFQNAVRFGREAIADGAADDQARRRMRSCLEPPPLFEWGNRAAVKARGEFFDEVVAQAWVAVEAARDEIMRDLERAEAERIAEAERTKEDAKRRMLRAKLAGVGF